MTLCVFLERFQSSINQIPSSRDTTAPPLNGIFVFSLFCQLKNRVGTNPNLVPCVSLLPQGVVVKRASCPLSYESL